MNAVVLIVVILAAGYTALTVTGILTLVEANNIVKRIVRRKALSSRRWYRWYALVGWLITVPWAIGASSLKPEGKMWCMHLYLEQVSELPSITLEERQELRSAMRKLQEETRG